MDNASKALYIAGSLLIAILVISLLVYSFDNLSIVEKQKDEISYQESIMSFNREYEAYNKRIMYGVDVISCINKAISNNEKYVKKINGNYGKWATGGASGEEALIDIKVVLNSNLTETFQIYYMNEKNKEAKIYKTALEDVKTAFKEDGIKNLKISEFFDVDDVTKMLTSIDKADTISKIFKDNTYCSFEYDKLPKNNELSLLKGDEFNESNNSLKKLVVHATELEIIRNNDKSDNSTWSSVKWTTLMADFKKRKFTCDEIIYSKDTGRVTELIFKEK